MQKNIASRNIAELVDHFQKGCKKNCIQKLGLEVEHFLVRRGTRAAVTYYEPRGVEWVLKQLQDSFPQAEVHNGHLIGFYNNDYAISLEPAAQIEISITPQESPGVIGRIYQSFRELIQPVLDAEDYVLETKGYQPASRVNYLPLIPKERYEFMDRYFQSVDTRGRNMMRGTASAQISIDYWSERDFVQKIRCAYILMPAIKLLTDNTAVFEGEPYSDYLARTQIWNHVDRDRCGILPGLFDTSFGFMAYAEYIWNLPLIFQPNDGDPVYTGAKRVRELWADRLFTPEDIDHVLSMVFPDARLKHYVEIRGADSMPYPYLMAYLALIKGIFFHSSVTSAIVGQFDEVRADDIRAAEDSLIHRGYDGMIYGMSAYEFIHKILLLAEQNLSPEEKELLNPMKELSDARTTLAKQDR